MARHCVRSGPSCRTLGRRHWRRRAKANALEGSAAPVSGAALPAPQDELATAVRVLQRQVEVLQAGHPSPSSTNDPKGTGGAGSASNDSSKGLVEAVGGMIQRQTELILVKLTGMQAEIDRNATEISAVRSSLSARIDHLQRELPAPSLAEEARQRFVRFFGDYDNADQTLEQPVKHVDDSNRNSEIDRLQQELPARTLTEEEERQHFGRFFDGDNAGQTLEQPLKYVDDPNRAEHSTSSGEYFRSSRKLVRSKRLRSQARRK